MNFCVLNLFKLFNNFSASFLTCVFLYALWHSYNNWKHISETSHFLKENIGAFLVSNTYEPFPARFLPCKQYHFLRRIGIKLKLYFTSSTAVSQICFKNLSWTFCLDLGILLLFLKNR